MSEPHVDDRVRLTRDIPELSLHRGDCGVVRSIWFAPSCAYEVEFDGTEEFFHTRALLVDQQIVIQEEEVAVCRA